MAGNHNYFYGQEWKLQGLCATSPYPDDWFGKFDNQNVARRLCNGCPVISQCLSYALANDEQFGVWGGMTTRDRKRLKRQMNKFLSKLEKQKTGQSQDAVERPTAS